MFKKASLFALLGFTIVIPRPIEAAVVDRILAVVNHEVILLSDIATFRRTFSSRAELDPLLNFSDKKSAMTDDDVLEFLIQERLIAQEYKVSDADVEQDIVGVLRRNQFANKDQLIAALQSRGLSYSDYVELMRSSHADRNLLDRAIRISISEDDIRNEIFQRELSHPGKNSANSPKLECAIQTLVIHKSDFKSIKFAQEAASSALKALKQGQSFTEVARQIPDSGESSMSESLDYLPIDQLGEPFRSAVRMLKVGQFSDVLSTPKGFMIVRLADIRTISGSDSKDLIALKESIRESLAELEYKRQLHLWAERAKNNAYIHINRR